MTQSSHTNNTLSANRSYSSLRSQPESAVSVQRPRSPFAYPARLKRPGFRPSSPVLTDEGVIDYSRRAEIERPLHDNGGRQRQYRTSSPSSLYLQRRIPNALFVYSDGIRSTTSLPVQPTAERRRVSPPMSQFELDTESSARTLSLASTVSRYGPGPSTPALTTPTPIYYDYSEGFAEDYIPSQKSVHASMGTADPPPTFRVDRTIPEDRPLSTVDAIVGMWPAASTCRYLSQPESVKLESESNLPLLSALGTHQGYDTTDKDSSDDSRSAEIASYHEQPGAEYQEYELPSVFEGPYGARSHSAPPRESWTLGSLSNIIEEYTDDHKSVLSLRDLISPGHGGSNVLGPESNRSSLYTIADHFPLFPKPPDGAVEDHRDHDSGLRSACGPIRCVDLFDTRVPVFESSPRPDVLRFLCSSPEGNADIHTGKEVVQPQASFDPAFKSDPNVQASRLSSIDNGVTDLVQLVDRFEAADKQPRGIHLDLPTLANVSVFDSKSKHQPQAHTYGTDIRVLTGLNVIIGGNTPKQMLDGPQSSAKKFARSISSERDGNAVLAYGGLNGNAIPNFSHTIPRKSISRSESPMLAPKPISPARILRLQNSVPQLMKALPPLPPTTPTSEVSYVQINSSYLPLTLDLHPEEKEKAKSPCTISAELETVPIIQPSADHAQSHRKFKLKTKSTVTLRPAAQQSITEVSGPWMRHSSDVNTGPFLQDVGSPRSKGPKFKLKVTRASDSSPGTVRVNREARHRSSLSTFDQAPKDLFTPSSAGLEGLYKQVTKQFSSRKNSESNDSGEENHVQRNPSKKERCNPIGNTSRRTGTPVHASVNIHSTTDVRSFFSDDSSQVRLHGSLRKRISNLRARIPYTMSKAAQSYDDITWRERRRRGLHSTRSSETGSNEANIETSRVTRVRQRLKIRNRVSSWLKDTRRKVIGAFGRMKKEEDSQRRGTHNG